MDKYQSGHLETSVKERLHQSPSVVDWPQNEGSKGCKPARSVRKVESTYRKRFWLLLAYYARIGNIGVEVLLVRNGLLHIRSDQGHGSDVRSSTGNQ